MKTKNTTKVCRVCGIELPDKVKVALCKFHREKKVIENNVWKS